MVLVMKLSQFAWNVADGRKEVNVRPISWARPMSTKPLSTRPSLVS